MTDVMGVTAGMIISVRSRHDVVVTDPELFLAAARRAVQDLQPGLSEAQAAAAVTDVSDAVFALLERDGELAPGIGPSSPDPGGTRIPAAPRAAVNDRADGLASAGAVRQIVLDDPGTLQGFGCFLPDDPFALPAPTGPAASPQGLQPGTGPGTQRGADNSPARPDPAAAPARTPEPVVAHLQAAALAAICSLTGPPTGSSTAYPNPHTGDLTAHDLGCMFSLDPSGTPPGDLAYTLDDVAAAVTRTAGGAARRRPRALWISAELHRLGHPGADTFTHLAEEPTQP